MVSPEYAESTNTLTSALKILQKKDFETMMGSGIIITLQKLDGDQICESFCLAAEDMQKVKIPIIESLIKSLEFRIVMRKSELEQINKALNKGQDSAQK